MIIANHMSAGTAAKATLKNNPGNDASPAGDFSAQLNKSFSAAHSNHAKSSEEASNTPNRDIKRSKPDHDAPANGLRSSSVDVLNAALLPTAAPQISDLNQAGSQLDLRVLSADNTESFGSSLSVNLNPTSSLKDAASGAASALLGTTVPSVESDISSLDATEEGGSGPIESAQQDADAAAPTATSAAAPTTVASDAPATPLATTQSSASAVVFPSSDDSSADVPVAASSAPQMTRPVAQQEVPPTNAHKAGTRAETPVQAPATVAPMSAAESLQAAQVFAGQQNHMAVPTNVSQKVPTLKQSSKADSGPVFDRAASLQNTLQNDGPVAIQPATVNSVNIADTSSPQGDSANSADRRSKEDAVVGVNSTATPISSPLMGSVLTAHQSVGAPISHSSQQAPSGPTAQTPASTASGLHSEIEPASTGDVKAAINTSKLIQTMNQSEMRVGMRTSEFGDISIRTSATHDSLLTQISLDHAELAKSLANHIPDLQARLATHGNHEVRINTSEPAAGTHSSMGSMSNSNSGSSSRQQSGSDRAGFTSSYGGSNFFHSALPTAAMASSMQSVRNDGRLDIQA